MRKDQPVFQDWPARLKSNWILLVWIEGQSMQIRLEPIGIQHIVIQIKISNAMKLIPPGPCNSVGDESGGTPVLGRKIVRRYAILFNRLRGYRRERPGDQVAIILQPIQHEVR